MRRPSSSYVLTNGRPTDAQRRSACKKPYPYLQFIPCDGSQSQHGRQSVRYRKGQINERQSQDQASANVPKSPSFWYEGAFDPFNSPFQVHVVIGYCAAVDVHWLRSGIAVAQIAELGLEAWETSPSAMLLAASCLGAMAQMIFLRPSGLDAALLKGRVLREVTQRLQSAEVATSDAVVCTLVWLAAFEVSRCNLEARVHLQGLRKILDVKSASKRSSDSKFTAPETVRSPPPLLVVIDLMQAIIFKMPLIIVDQPDAADQMGLVKRLKHVLVNEAEECARSWNGELGSSNALTVLATRASNCVTTALTDSDIDAGTASRFWDSLEELRRRYCVDKPGHEASADDKAVARCCYHAFALLYNAVVNRRRFSHSSMRRHALGLSTAARAVNHFAKEHMPCFRSWSMIVGLLTSNDTTQTSLFHDKIIGLVHSSSRDRWADIKDLFLDAMVIRERFEVRAAPCHEVVSDVQMYVAVEEFQKSLPPMKPKREDTKISDQPHVLKTPAKEKIFHRSPKNEGADEAMLRALRLLEADRRFFQAVQKNARATSLHTHRLGWIT